MSTALIALAAAAFLLILFLFQAIKVGAGPDFVSSLQATLMSMTSPTGGGAQTDVKTRD